ncbi:MAG: cadherin-like beta sandwich domain-containing protein, partial [Chloroflexota bacterium]|nr:cadherin-like beta sandwich domain-containing protein [Chloroflexota bacterium]
MTTDEDASLSEINITENGEPVTLDPQFDPATTLYTATVDAETVSLSASAAATGAGITQINIGDEVTGFITPASTVSMDADLAEGAATVILLRVLAADQVTTETYYVILSRPADSSVPDIIIEADPAEYVAGIGPLTFTLTRGGDTTDSLGVIVNLTQTEEWLSNLSRTANFTAGDSETTIILVPADFSSSVTRNGNLAATVAPVADYDTGGVAQVRVISQEGPAVTVMLEHSTYTVAENAGTLEVDLVARAHSSVPRIDGFNVSIVSDAQTASSSEDSRDFHSVSTLTRFNSSDFLLEDGVLVGSKTVTITIVDDAIYEGDETFHLHPGRAPGLTAEVKVLDPEGAECSTTCPKPYVVTITDDDLPVPETDDDEEGVVIQPTSVTVPEGHSTHYTVALGTQPTGDVTVTINDPADNTDVTVDEATLTFTTDDWDTPQLVTVNAATDTDEDEDSATITHSVSGYGTVTTANDVTVTVTEADRVNVEIKHEEQRHNVREGTSKEIKVLLDQDPERTLVIGLSGKGVRGATSDDYTIPAFVIFSPGETEQTYTFTAVDDTIDDDGVGQGVDHERVEVSFTDLPGGVSVGIPRRAFVNIVDNDKPETVYVSFTHSTISLAEGSRASGLGVRLNEPPERQISNILLVWEYQGGATNADASGFTSRVSFAPTHTSVGFGNVELDQDRIDEQGEGLKLSFGELPEGVALGTPSEIIFTFLDDDTAGVTVNPTTLTVAEGEDETYTIELDSQPTADVTVTIDGTSGTDLTLDSSTLTFTTGAWDAAKTVTVTAAQDSDAENDSVTLTHTVTSTDTLYGGISADNVDVTVDDDEDTSVSVTVEFGSAAYSVAESDDASTTETKENEVTVTVKLSADPERTVTIPIEKTEQGGASSADYSGVPANVVFNSSDTEKSFTFTATADTVDDDGESVKLTFGTTLPTGVTEGTTRETVITINDDDPPPVAVTIEHPTYTVAEDAGTLDVVVVAQARPGATSVDDFVVGILSDAQTAVVDLEFPDYEPLSLRPQFTSS